LCHSELNTAKKHTSVRYGNTALIEHHSILALYTTHYDVYYEYYQNYYYQCPEKKKVVVWFIQCFIICSD